MASVLAIVSKALFEKMVPKDVKPGVVVETDRYKSSNKSFDGLGKGDAIFLVTVRPPDEKLWLVGVLESPAKKGGDWVSAANQTPIADVTAAIKKLQFESGTGLKAKKGALGMSLQTPRVLTAGDVKLLRGLAPKGKGGKKVAASAAYKEAVEETVGKPKPKKKAAAAKKKSNGKAAASAGVLRLENARWPFKGKLADLEPFEIQQLDKCVDGGSTKDAFANPGNLDESWIEASIVDVVDDATDAVKYQIHLFGYGDGGMFANESTQIVASFCQHSLDYNGLSRPETRALGAAWAKDAKRLKINAGHLDWDDDDDEDEDEEEEEEE